MKFFENKKYHFINFNENMKFETLWTKKLINKKND